MSLSLYFQRSSKKPQFSLAAAYSGGNRGGESFSLAAGGNAGKPNIKACDCLIGLDWRSRGRAVREGLRYLWEKAVGDALLIIVETFCTLS